METSPIMVDRKREEAREMKKRLVEGEVLMEKLHGGERHPRSYNQIRLHLAYGPRLCLCAPTRKTIYSFDFLLPISTIYRCPGKNIGKPHEKLDGKTFLS